MLDAPARRLLDRPLSELARLLDRPFVSPNGLTLLGLATGLASAATAASQAWWWALGLWLFSRAMDGLDGPLARRRADADGVPTRSPGSSAGGFLDRLHRVRRHRGRGRHRGDTSVRHRLVPFLLVLFAYYVNGTAFLAFSSVAERTGRQRDDGRSLSFLGGLAEGVETIAVRSLWLVLPAHAGVIATVWAAVVGLSAAQRIVAGFKDLA